LASERRWTVIHLSGSLLGGVGKVNCAPFLGF
jgi:hypothetical protein